MHAVAAERLISILSPLLLLALWEILGRVGALDRVKLVLSASGRWDELFDLGRWIAAFAGWRRIMSPGSR